jgi:nucleosome assembly protein 1-like 1
VRVVKKRQKHKSTGTVRTILKEEKQDSFFNYFDAPTADGLRPSFRHVANPDAAVNEEEDEDEIGEDLCNADFEIGHFFKEFIVPKAVLYYTGDLLDQGSFGSQEDEELDDFLPEENEEEEEEEEEEGGDTDDMTSDATEPKGSRSLNESK